MTPAQLNLIHEDLAGIADRIGDPLSALSGKRLLLTGANSYVGAYMADMVVWLNDYFLDQPCQLIPLVRSPLTQDSRIGHLVQRSDVTILQQDVCDPIEIDAPAEFIIHAASNASPKRYLAQPIDTIDANVWGTRQLLELARKWGTESFLFFSSSEIYGDVPADQFPTRETYPGMIEPTHPRACYSEAKRLGETLCATFWRQHQVPAKIARVFFIYGPGIQRNDGRVVGDFINCRLDHRPIEILSDGLGVRAFNYIADATEGFFRALLSNENGEAFNIGGDTTTTIRELATIVAQAEDPEIQVAFPNASNDHLVGAPQQVCPCLNKSRERLGYNPTTDLPTGIARTLRWYRLAT